MSKIKVSVIIPVYNSEKLLNQCIDSICNQTLKDIEIICIDDGSTDNSPKILKEYEKKDSRIIALSQKNSGAGVARNKGIDIANGEYIAFVDSDDWIEDNALEKLYNNIKNNDSDMVLFNSIEHKPNKEFRKRIYLKKDDSIDYNNYTFDYHKYRNFVMNGFLVIWSKFYKKSFIKDNNIKFYSHEIFNDIQFHIQSMLLAKKISYLPEILYHYRRMGQNSLQTSRAVTQRGFVVFDIFNEIEEWLKDNGFFEELETNFYRFVLTESQVRLNGTDVVYKEDLFKIIKYKIMSLNITTESLKKMNIKNYRFYIHIINSNSYFEYNKFLEATQKENNHSNLNLKYLLDEKDKEIESLKENAFGSVENINFTAELINRLKKFNLFDDEFYVSNYDCENMDPIIHYVYKGYKMGNRPNDKFDAKFYAKFNKNVANSNLDPFFYFVLYGLDEGKIKINNKTYQPNSINKIDFSAKIKRFNKLGINKNKRKPRIIVSLTSFPERMYDIHYCLYSLLTQQIKPDMLVLWLAESQFPNKEKDIPQEVLSLKENGLEIKWCEDMISYKKLLPIRKQYPQDIIVTVDDDVFYPSFWLKELYETHIKYPDCIISQRARKISFNEDNSFKEYVEWEFNDNNNEPSFLNFFTGAGGTLYPPDSLRKDALNYDLAKKIAPYGDDIWFWGMAVLNKTKIVAINHLIRLTYVNPAREVNLLSEKTLWNSNETGGNNIYLKNMIDEFPEILDIVNSELRNTGE